MTPLMKSQTNNITARGIGRLLANSFRSWPMIILSFACLAVSQPLLAKGPPADQSKPRIEVCFVLDTTGSMGGLIDGAKQKIWSIANEMISAKPTPQLKLGLIGYRDRGTNTSSNRSTLPTTSTPSMVTCVSSRRTAAVTLLKA
jgi:hypothetical protein